MQELGSIQKSTWWLVTLLAFIPSWPSFPLWWHVFTHFFILLSSVQLLSRVRLFETPWITARQASLSITNSQSSLRLTSIESVMPSSHLILGHPLLLLTPIPPSIRVFPSESTLRMRWPKYWSFSFSIIPSKEIPGLISFRMEYYSAIKKNTCESVLMRWMKLEPIIQSEVSQKEKHQYCKLMHINGI